MIRSAISVGANYRAVCRARSKAEFTSKLSMVIEEADDTDMLTVWFSLHDTNLEQGPLKVVPGSHRRGLRTHCANYLGKGG